MATATAQANPNIAFTKRTEEKLYRTNGKVCSVPEILFAEVLISGEIKTKQIG
jgi:hypothetical protein